MAFKEENGRAPNNKEAKLKALSMNDIAHFKASKGWLRRFAARHKFTFSAVKNFKKKPKKRNSVTSETKTDFSVSTTETFLNSVDLPQLGDEFFNFEESPRPFVNNTPKTIPTSTWQLENLHQVFPQEDLDIYSFLKLDGGFLETENFQNISWQLAQVLKSWENAKVQKYSENKHMMGFRDFGKEFNFLQDRKESSHNLYYENLYKIEEY